MNSRALWAILLIIFNAFSAGEATAVGCFDGSNDHFKGNDSVSTLRGKNQQFEFCQRIDHDLFLYYTPLVDDSKVLIGLHAVKNTFGWTALAIAGNGGMKGASQIVVRKIEGTSNSTWVVEDRNSQGYTTPSLDDSQDLELVFAEQTAAGETAWGVLLPMNSCDESDYTIHNVSTFMHWALGNDHTFSYHGKRRGQFQANLLSAPLEPNQDVTDSSAFDLVMPNVSIISGEDTKDPTNPYICTYIDLEQVQFSGPGGTQLNVNASEKYHAVQVEPVLSENSKQYVHHMILYACPSEFGESSDEDIYHNKLIPSCERMAPKCNEFKFGWALGITGETMPENVGLPFGQGKRWLVLQTHYYNPGLDEGVFDSSGLRVRIAPELRDYDAGVLAISGAAEAIQHTKGIPAGVEDYEMPAFVVPSGCTYSMWKEPIKVLSVFHHMHLYGRKMDIEVRRDGQSLGVLREEKHYDFTHQSIAPSLVSRLLPGDEIFLRCRYDTSGVSQNISFGERSNDEMCLGLVRYWPQQELESMFQIDPSPMVEQCQTSGSGSFANRSRCAQNFYEDTPGFFHMGRDHPEPFDALYMCNSGVYEDYMMPKGLDLCPDCYLSKNCTADEVAAYAQDKVCADYCSMANVSVYPDLSATDGFNRGISGCTSGDPQSDIRFFNVDSEELEPRLPSSCEMLAMEAEDTIEGDTAVTDLEVWKLVSFAIGGVMAMGSLLFIVYQSVSNMKGARYKKAQPGGIMQKWTSGIHCLDAHVVGLLRSISCHAAAHPISYIVGTIVLSLGLLSIGLGTNFPVQTDTLSWWTPTGAKPEQHLHYIRNTFKGSPRALTFMVHQQGDNVLSQEGVNRVFTALDTVRRTTGFGSVCSYSNFINRESGERACRIHGVSAFWNHTTSLFGTSIGSNEEVSLALSAEAFPDGSPVDIEGLVGYPEWSSTGRKLTGGQSFFSIIDLPDQEEAQAYEFEKDAVDNLLRIRNEWEEEKGNPFRLEIQATRSFDDEAFRAIEADLPLIPLVFVVMSIFVCMVYSKRDAGKSQGLLGLGAVVSVVLSILSGFGLMFSVGVPYTSMTQLLPFIVLGIGLDDAFIITGAYKRTDPEKDPVQRIDDCMSEAGLSIAITTITSVMAFGLGTLSSIPAVDWLCCYAIPALVLTFLYQITFFVALIVMDERRIKANRRDCCFCLTATSAKNPEPAEIAETAEQQETAPLELQERIMMWYSEKLLQPRVKVLVLSSFAVLFGGLAYSASLLTKDFKLTELLPKDSYATDDIIAYHLYNARSTIMPYMYFRGVDQSNRQVQQQMEDYVNDMADLGVVGEQPPYFWLRHFRQYDAMHFGTSFEALSFQEKLQQFLEEPIFKELYDNDIVLDEEGNIISSRVPFFLSDLDLDSVEEQVKTLNVQREVSIAQSANHDKKDWPFFAYHRNFNLWEFYSVAADELLFTSAIGILSVSVAALILIPHWSGALFVFPLLSVLYIDLLGFLQLMGASVNAISYISVVMAIGLMVDYILHILIKYCECKGSRDDKVKETLQTMGNSILLGALTSFLGIAPLVFSTSDVFKTVFYAFIGLIVLGVLHGLVLLPVLLSLLGPVDLVCSEGCRGGRHSIATKSMGNLSACLEAGKPSEGEDGIETDD